MGGQVEEVQDGNRDVDCGGDALRSYGPDLAQERVYFLILSPASK